MRGFCALLAVALSLAAGTASGAQGAQTQTAQTQTAQTQRAAVTPEWAQSNSDTDGLCQLFHSNIVIRNTNLGDHIAQENAKVLRAELLRRGATTPEEWTLSDAGHITLGMHRCIVFAMLGTPVDERVFGGLTVYTFPPNDRIGFRNGIITGAEFDGYK